VGISLDALDTALSIAEPCGAALLARMYAPFRVAKAFNAWRGELDKKGRVKVGARIADPLRREGVSRLRKAGRTRCTAKTALRAGRRTGCTLTMW